MYTDELLAIARQNELREQADRSRLVTQVRGDRPGKLARSLSAVREQIRNLTATYGDPTRRIGRRRRATALR